MTAAVATNTNQTNEATPTKEVLLAPLVVVVLLFFESIFASLLLFVCLFCVDAVG